MLIIQLSKRGRWQPLLPRTRWSSCCCAKILPIGCFSLLVAFLIGCGPNPALDRPAAREVSTDAIVTVSHGFKEPQPNAYREQRKVENSIVIGLDADMTSGSAQAGEAIRRGVVLAIDEVNAAGGLLGRPLELVVRDHRGNPERGVDNIVEFSEMRDVIAVVGGIHTPVALRELETIHEKQMIYLGPWAAGTPIVANSYSPNFVFRVSVRDEYAGEFLVQSAMDRGLRKLGLLLEQTGWGRSNEKAVKSALQQHGLAPVGLEWFNWGDDDMTENLQRLRQAGAEAVIFVGNPLEGKVAVDSMAQLESTQRMPIISHWGVSGGDFAKLTEASLEKVDLTFLQTYSFITPPHPERNQRIFSAYAKRFHGCQSPRDVFSPVGTAHAYEIVMMLAAAIKQVETIDRSAVREALENLESYTGIIRDYSPPFRRDHHDALTADDFVMARYASDGAIEPVLAKRAVEPSE